MVLARSLVAVSLALSLSAVAIGCGPDVGEIPPPNLQLQGPGRPETKTMSPTCGTANTLMVIGYSGDVSPEPNRCGESVKIGGVEVKGRRTFNEQDNRWSLAVTVPDGVQGEVLVACGNTDVSFGKFTQPCTQGADQQSKFEAFRGPLTMSPGCDDSDGKVALQDFTLTSFVMTGLSGNPSIRFRIVDETTAVASDVVQFGKPGHTVRLVIGSDGKISLFASSSAGSCQANLSKQ